MFFIPGFVIAILTFPGVIVHEIAHQLFCRIAGVAIFEVCYFRLGNPSGYVVHEIPNKASQQLLIGVGPFIINTLLGALIALPAAIPIFKFNTGTLMDCFFIWLGVSIAMHAFPSTGDAKSIWKIVENNDAPFVVRLIAAPISGIIFLGAIGSIFWLDLFYGIGVAIFVPNLIVKLFS